MRKIVGSIVGGALLVGGGFALATVIPQHAGPAPGHGRITSGLVIEHGMIPAAMVSGFPQHWSARVVRQDIANGSDAQLLMVGLFDQRTGKRITDAKVTAALRKQGGPAVSKTLVSLNDAGASIYGNTFKLSPSASYSVELSIRRPGTSKTAKTTFSLAHK